MDFLSELPPLILGEILQQLTTFESLHSAISASPALYRVFRDLGPTVINTIATSSLEPELHNLLNAIARIRNEPISHSITTLDQFRETYTANLSSPERHLLSLDTTPQVAFGLVATLVNIRRLSIAVLDELMQRTSKLRPQHSVKRNIDFASGAYARVPGKDPWPAGQAAPVAPSAIQRAPSWVEYYRVQRPLLLLQLALELRSHAPWLAWGIPGASSESREWSVARIISWLPLGHDTALVAKVLEEVVAARVMPTWDGIVSTLQSPIISLTKMPRCVSSSNPGREPSEEPQDDAVGIEWPHDRSAVRERSDGRRILSQLVGSRHAMLTRVMLDKIMHPGLMIWDRERLCDLGLMDEPRIGQAEGKWWENEDRRPQMSEDEIWFAWYSVGCGPP